MKRIDADFNNMDPEGFLRLNTIGTMSDLSEASIVLENGIRLIVSDGDLVAEIAVRPPGSEGIWRGQVMLGPFDIDDERASMLLSRGSS